MPIFRSFLIFIVTTYPFRWTGYPAFFTSGIRLDFRRLVIRPLLLDFRSFSNIQWPNWICLSGVPQEQRAGVRREGQGPRLHRGDRQGTTCPWYCVDFLYYCRAMKTGHYVVYLMYRQGRHFFCSYIVSLNIFLSIFYLIISNPILNNFCLYRLYNNNTLKVSNIYDTHTGILYFMGENS